jgi:predicted adenine nucleotide alpha hydrolase (AANH) superfamily ATPase
MRILLHTCCGPCMLPVAEKLRADGHDVATYFYNPNIHPRAEYERRLEAYQAAAQALGVNSLPPPQYEPQSFFRAVTFREDERCRLCYQLRLFEAALACRDDGFDAFTTTLLVSPYQDIEAIRRVADAAAAAVEVRFHFEDFRPLFPRAKEMAQGLDLYHQKYCGCLYSEIEAEEGRRRKKERGRARA